MQKKLIALAVAGLVSAPAFAQSNVTIYGIVDMGYTWRDDNIGKGIDARSGIDSGISAGSRLGFKGSEDLGNGLKAGFVLEQGFNADTGRSAQDSRTFGRQAFASLSGGFGTVALGRQYTPSHVFGSAFDPFGKGTVGQFNNVYYSNSGPEVRLDNLAAYVSPNWGGFSFITGYTLSADGNEALENDGDVRVFAFAPRYTNGPIDVAFNYHEARADISGNPKVRVYDLFGGYDFGMVKLTGAAGWRKPTDQDFLMGGLGSVAEDTFQWMLGVTVPLGQWKILASYSNRKTDLVDSGDAKVWQAAVGAEYALSKRTSLYTTYAQIDNNKNAENASKIAGNTGIAGSVGDASNGGMGYQQGFNFGLRHTF